MCRNIKTLANFDPPATPDEIRASALQFVRKLSGMNKPSKANEEAFNRALEEVTAAAERLISSLTIAAPPRNRELEAVKARERARRRFATVIVAAVTASSLLSAQPLTPELSEAARKAQLDGAIAGWCRGEFRPGQSGAFAVGISGGTGTGRYAVLDRDGTLNELAPFTAGAQIACYSPAEARKLSRSIARSETVEGWIRPRWKTTVVCGFVENTRAVCWQYSLTRHAYVEVGGWIT